MVFDLLTSHTPTLPALHVGSRTATRAELALAGRRAATFLRKRGLVRGDAFAVWLPDGEAWLQLLFGAAQLGVLMVPISTRLRQAEAQHLVATARARVLFVPPSFLGFDYAAAARGIASALDHLEQVIEVEPEAGFQWADCEPLGDWIGQSADPLCTFSTSGTTGKPKLAVHAAAGIATHARHAARATDLRAGDVALCAVPLYGVFGFVQAMAALSAGAATVCVPVFEPQAAADLIARHRVTHFHGSDAMFERVLAVAGARLSSWRRGGFADFAGVSAQVAQRAWEDWGLRLGGLYGMSECFALTAVRDPDEPFERRVLGGGTPVSTDIAFRIVDPHTGAVLPEGGQGELQLRGYNLMIGYLNNPDATAAAFTADGWFRTGDLAYADGGSFCYLARLKDSLRLRGYLVDPSEIEEFLCGHPGVQAAQVVGVHRPGEGDVAVAFVIPAAQPADEATLLAHCKAGIAGFKVPRRIVAIDAFPSVDGPNGTKIQKNVLRDRAAELFADPPSATGA